MSGADLSAEDEFWAAHHATALAADLLRPIIRRHLDALPVLTRMCVPASLVDRLPEDLASVLVPVVEALVAARTEVPR